MQIIKIENDISDHNMVLIEYESNMSIDDGKQKQQQNKQKRIKYDFKLLDEKYRETMNDKFHQYIKSHYQEDAIHKRNIEQMWK
jgi:hypothetical protein